MRRKPREKLLMFPAEALVRCRIVGETPRLYRVRTHRAGREMLVAKGKVIMLDGAEEQ